MHRAFLPASTCLALIALASPALAQEAEVTVAPPTVGVPVTPTPSGAAVAVTPAAPPPNAEKEEKKKEEDKEKKEPEDSVHVRFGMGLDADLIYSPKTATQPQLTGFGAGLQFRLGAQIDQWFAVYYQPHAILGGTISETKLPSIPGVKSPIGGLPSATLVGAVFNSGLAELTLPVLHLGAGPSCDIVGIKDFEIITQGAAKSPGTKAYFGIDGRAAIVIGGHGPGSHAGIAINANIHPVFFNGATLLVASVGLGGEFY